MKTEKENGCPVRNKTGIRCQPEGSILETNNEDVPAGRKYYDPVLKRICENIIAVPYSTSLFCKLVLFFM